MQAGYKMSRLENKEGHQLFARCIPTIFELYIYWSTD